MGVGRHEPRRRGIHEVDRRRSDPARYPPEAEGPSGSQGDCLGRFHLLPSGGEPETRGDLSQQIRDAYCRTSGGRWNVRVRLADLRGALPGVPREEFDGALLALETAGALVLYPLDDPQEIRPGDEAAALPNSLGIRRHILYIER